MIEQFIRFLMVLFRVSGLFVVLPVLGGQQVPRRIRVCLAVFLAFAVYPLVSAKVTFPVPTDLVGLTIGLASELLIGIVCGFIVNIIFIAAQMAGQMLARHMGTALARVINPLFNAQIPIVGQFYYTFTLLIFVILNGHQRVIVGIISTFDRIPIMGASYRNIGGMIDLMAGLMGDMFIMMVRIAAPAFLALFIVTVVLGVIARTVPQINVLIIGFPVKIAVGLAVMVMSLKALTVILSQGFDQVLRDMARMIEMMAPPPP